MKHLSKLRQQDIFLSGLEQFENVLVIQRKIRNERNVNAVVNIFVGVAGIFHICFYFAIAYLDIKSFWHLNAKKCRAYSHHYLQLFYQNIFYRNSNTDMRNYHSAYLISTYFSYFGFLLSFYYWYLFSSSQRHRGVYRERSENLANVFIINPHELNFYLSHIINILP